MRYTDTHCHILPGIDDGPRDLAESVRMARMAENDGIDTIVATPHIVEGFYDGSDLLERVEELGAAIAGYGIKLKLYPGAEVPMSRCLEGNPEELGGLTLAGGRYLLMETAETTFDQLARAAHQVRLCGLYPVLAHPERSGSVMDAPERLEDLLTSGGSFCQITASSVEGVYGKRLKKTALSLIRKGYVHLVASDAHSSRTRVPRLSGSFRTISGLFGEETARLLTIDNPRRVINDEPLENIEIRKRRGPLSWMTRRG